MTGYSIFSYSGHSALYEAEREEGEPKKAWLSEWKPKGGYGAIPECVEPFEEPANGAILYRRDEKEFVGGRFGDNPVRVRIARTFFGVRLPRFTDWWDVRTDEKTRTGSNPERDEGVKAQYFLKSSYDGATPTSCQHYADSCKRGFSHHSAKEVQDIRDRLAEMWWKWRKAHRKPARHGQGGGVVYAPVWVEFGNYGWSIHSLEKMGVVEQSRSEAWMFWRDEGKDEGGKGK